jgi:DNA polymerase III subunit gamma/tau
MVDNSVFEGQGSLAVRHRPRKFSEVVGQRHVKVPLQKAISMGKLPQQLLLSGGSGLGKTTLARICAAALLCDTPLKNRPEGDCCGFCKTCTEVASGTHPDVIEIDAASNGRVDEIRELASRAHLAPMRGFKRVYIIDEAHGLSSAGGQAFLKLLEEPPAHVVFMLATTDPEKMLHTNRSRCTQFELSPPSFEEMVDNLTNIAQKEGVSLSKDDAFEIASSSPLDLGVRGTLMALEKVLPLLVSGLDEEISEALGRPSTKAMSALFAALETGDLAESLDIFKKLRARYPLSQLMARISDSIETMLVDVSLKSPNSQDVDKALKASDIILVARRDNSELSAMTSIVKLASLWRSMDESMLSSLKFVNPQKNGSSQETPGPSSNPVLKDKTNNKAISGDSPPQNSEDSIFKQQDNKNLQPDKSPDVDSSPRPRSEYDGLYAYDPFSAPLKETFKESISDLQKNTENSDSLDNGSSLQGVGSKSINENHVDTATVLQKVVEAVSSLGTPKARLLAAKLRSARVSTNNDILKIEGPEQVLSALKASEELVKEASAAAGFSVSW